VIPRPAEGMEDLIFTKGSRSEAAIDQLLAGEEVDEIESEEDAPEEPYAMPEGLTPEAQKHYDKLNAMTVHELRSHARSVEGLSIHGREISRANKRQLLEELMRVHEEE